MFSEIYPPVFNDISKHYNICDSCNTFNKSRFFLIANCYGTLIFLVKGTSSQLRKYVTRFKCSKSDKHNFTHFFTHICFTRRTHQSGFFSDHKLHVFCFLAAYVVSQRKRSCSSSYTCSCSYTCI